MNVQWSLIQPWIQLCRPVTQRWRHAIMSHDNSSKTETINSSVGVTPTEESVQESVQLSAVELCFLSWWLFRL